MPKVYETMRHGHAGLLTWAALLEKLYRERFTGAVTLHWAEGVPNAYDFPVPPVRLRLDKSDRRA